MSGTTLASLLLPNAGAGLSGGTVPMSTAQTIALYKRSVERAAQDIARLEKDPAVQRDLRMLEQAVARAKTPADLLRNPRIIALLMEALGLADQAANGGLARAALQSNLSDRQSLANRLPDQRWKAAAQRLDFAARGLATIRDPAVMDDLKEGIIKNRRIGAISAQSQAVADALYIRDLPEGQTPSLFAVLGDKVKRRVATTVANLPQELALHSVETQARTLGARFDPAQFADPKKREALINRYLIVASSAQTSSQQSGDTMSAALRIRL